MQVNLNIQKSPWVALYLNIYPKFPISHLHLIYSLQYNINGILKTKKAPEGANFKNGGNDEARTRDLMRDRHAL